MANRKNSHRRRVRVAVLMVLCGAVFAAFFARLAWMQFVRADYYADKAAEASSASYTVTQHAARGAIVDSAGVVLARDTTVYDVYLRIPAPPGTDLRVSQVLAGASALAAVVLLVVFRKCRRLRGCAAALPWRRTAFWSRRKRARRSIRRRRVRSSAV